MVIDSSESERELWSSSKFKVTYIKIASFIQQKYNQISKPEAEEEDSEMSFVGPLLPALVPLTTLLWLRAADHSVSISRNSWDSEYDYIIGKLGTQLRAFLTIN